MKTLQKKSSMIPIRVTLEEKKQVEARAKEFGDSVSKFLLKAATQCTIISPTLLREIAQLLYLLQWNLHKIENTKGLNTLELQSKLGELTTLINHYLKGGEGNDDFKICP